MNDDSSSGPRHRPGDELATDLSRPGDPARDPASKLGEPLGPSVSRPRGPRRDRGGGSAARGPRRKDVAGPGPGHRKPGDRKRPSDPIDRKAAEIAKRSGLPLPMALEVAAGTCTMNEALRRLMRRDKADRLSLTHGLTKAVALGVVDGKTTLEAALLAKGLVECAARQPERSALADLLASGQAGSFYSFGEEPFVARVSSIEKFEVILAPEGAPEERKLLKHVLRFVATDLAVSDVEGLLGTAPEVASLGLGPSTSYRDRFRSSKKVLFAHHRDRLLTRVVLRDGTVLTGFVGWFGKWEFELQLIDPRKAKPAKAKSVGSVVIFRHALHALEPAT